MLIDRIQGLGQLVDDKESADIHFMCGTNSQPLYAHRAVLAMRCARFRALFASGTLT